MSHIKVRKRLLTSPAEPWLYSIPLNNSFPADGPLPSNSYYKIQAPKQWASQGAFFQDAGETMLYCFAGYLDTKQPPINYLNTFNISSGEWYNVAVAGGDFNYDQRIATSRAVSADTSEALGFVTGGWNDLGGMIRFDASDPASPEWRNETDNSPPLTLAGGMEFIRLGPKGSLINFGGYNKDYIHTDRKNWTYDRRPMNQINVYDVDSATWYNVTAGGDVPNDRAAFCTAVSSAPDDSSFQITMYAGWGRVESHSYADTYVLSIPSFQWINVTDSSNLDARLADGIARSGRKHHQCAAYKDRQMLVLGGELTIGNDTQNLGGCSRKFPAIRVLDLSTFRWKSNWVGGPEPYTVPDAVTRIIGGNGQGGATMKQPKGGFNDSALNNAFAQVAPRYTLPSVSAASGNPGSNDGSQSNGSDDGSSKINTGAIAGGAVGGVAALAIIAALVFFFLRRRKRRETPRPEIPPTAVRDPKPAELGQGQNSQMLDGEHAKPPIEGMGWKGGGGGGGNWSRGYEPVAQEMDTGYRGCEVPGDEN
jgi:hypothetical protein